MILERLFKMLDTKWKKRFLKLSKEIAEWSKDPSTKVGALIISEDKNIISTGYNGFPRGIEDTAKKILGQEESKTEELPFEDKEDK